MSRGSACSISLISGVFSGACNVSLNKDIKDQAEVALDACDKIELVLGKNISKKE